MSSSTSPKIAGSGSIQSHLSTANQRLRPSTTSSSSTDPDLTLHKNNHDDVVPPFSFYPSVPSPSRAFQNILAVMFQPFHSDKNSATSTSSPSQWMSICTRAVVLFYFCFSLIFTSAMIYSKMENGSFEGPSRISPMNSLSESQRFSRLLPFPLSANSTNLSPYLIHGIPTGSLSSITLCLWEDISNATTDAVVQLTSQWKGQVSLLLTTSDPPSHHAPFLQRLETWTNHSSLSALSVHVLQLSAHPGPYSPNALLNIARLLAPTSTVLLFPGSLALNLDLSNLVANAPLSQDLVLTERPLLYSSNVSLPVILVDRDYGLWCTERPFFNTRKAAWNECLWQFWLNSYGRLDHFNTTSVNFASLKNENSAGDFTEEIYKRLSSRFRSETCDLNIKRLATSASPLSQNETRNLRWLKQFCRQMLEDSNI